MKHAGGKFEAEILVVVQTVGSAPATRISLLSPSVMSGFVDQFSKNFRILALLL
jgi:hypothetical protein